MFGHCSFIDNPSLYSGAFGDIKVKLRGCFNLRVLDYCMLIGDVTVGYVDEPVTIYKLGSKFVDQATLLPCFSIFGCLNLIDNPNLCSGLVGI